MVPVLSVPPHSPVLLSLSAGAGLNRHIGVNLEHWVSGFILIKHSKRIHFFWYATGLGNARDDPDGADYALDGGVVGRPRHLGEV